MDSVEESPIAMGAQGEVFKGEYQGDVVALKKMSLVGVTATRRNKMMKDFATELAIMVQLRSPRIVQVFGVVTTESSWLGLVVEYCEGGDLTRRLTRPTPAGFALRGARGVAAGMIHLHHRGVLQALLRLQPGGLGQQNPRKY